MTQLAGELPGFIPGRADITPELSDDSSPRHRAELSSKPERHLINIPLSERQPKKSHAPSSTASILPSPHSSRHSPRVFSTADGVILSPNLDGSLPNENENEGNTLGTENGHVLSFMTYSPEGPNATTSVPSVRRQGAVHGSTGVQTSNTITAASTLPRQSGPVASSAKQLQKIMHIRIPPSSTSRGHGRNSGGTELPG
jgi:hypothetical protein